MKASVDVDGSGGVGVEAGCTGAVGPVAGADEVALVSSTGTTGDLCALGTLQNTCVVAFPFLSSSSSWSSSTDV